MAQPHMLTSPQEINPSFAKKLYIHHLQETKSFQIYQDTTPGTCTNSQGLPWGQSGSKCVVAASLLFTWSRGS